MKTSNHHLISGCVEKAVRSGVSFKRWLAMAALFSLPVTQALAGTDTWTGGAAAWNTSSNWNSMLGPVPGSGDIAYFNSGSGSLAISFTTGNLSLGGMTFDGGAAAYTIGSVGGSSFTLTSGGIIQSTAALANIETINAPISLAGAYTFSSNSSTLADTLNFGGTIALGSNTLTLSGTNTGANTINGAIGGTGSLILNGLGTWELAGNNGYTGTTTVGGGGTLEIATASGGAIVGSKALTLNGGEFDYNGTGNTTALTTGSIGISSGANTIQADGSGTMLTLGGVTRTIGATVNFVTTGSGTAATIDASSAGIAFNQGEFFDGSNYAYATANGAIGAVVYGTTTNAFNVSGALSSATNTIYQITGASSVNAINIGSGTIKFGGAYTLSTSGTTPSTIGGFLVSGVNGTISGSGGLRENGDMVFRTDLSGDTLTVSAPIVEFNQTVAGTIPVKTGAGTLKLSGTNTYLGNAFVDQGTLTALSSSALGFGGNVNVVGLAVGTTTVNVGGTLDLDGATSAIVVDEPIILSGGSLVNNSSANATTLDNGVAGLKFTSLGSGYTGGNTVVFSSGNATATATAVSGNTAEVALTTAGSGYTTAPTFTVTGNGGSGASGTTVLSSLTLNGTANTIGGVGNMIINAAVADGTPAGGFSKTGTGTVTLAGANTYTGGTTVNAGTLLGNSSASTGTGTVSVASNVSTGAVLGGTGTVTGAVTVGGGSAGTSLLWAGAGGAISNFTLNGGVTLGTNSGLEFNLNTSGMSGNGGTVFGTGTNGYSDLLTINGSLSLGNGVGTLSLNNLGTSTALTFGDVIVLATSTGVSGSFNGIADGADYISGANTFQVNYGTLSGYSNDLTLDVVAAPEPSTVALTLGGLGFLFLWARRRSRLVS